MWKLWKTLSTLGSAPKTALDKLWKNTGVHPQRMWMDNPFKIIFHAFPSVSCWKG